jgi:predicted porin
MTTQRALLLGLLALLLPGIAPATDMSLSLGVFSEYDSNVFRRNRAVDDDFLFRLIPGIRIHQDRGENFNYSLAYQVPAEIFIDYGNQLNDVDHLVDAGISYNLDNRLDLYLRNDFRYLRNTLRTQSTLDSVGLPVVSTGRARVTLNELTAGARYRLKPRIDGGLELAYRLYEITRADRSDNTTVNATADVSYLLSDRQQVGGGMAYGRQAFDETINLVSSTSNAMYAFVQWSYTVGETLEIELELGPSYTVVNQHDPEPRSLRTIPFVEDPADASRVLTLDLPSCLDLNGTKVFADCDLGPSFARPYIESFGTTRVTTAGTLGNSRDTVVDAFARVNITKRWAPDWTTSLRYTRAPGVASGLGGTVIRNALTAAVDWDIAPKWSLLMRGDWVRRRSIANANQIVGVAEDGEVATGDPQLADVAATQGSQFGAALESNRVRNERFSVLGRLTYYILRNTEAMLQVRYDNQNSKQNTLGEASDFDAWIATIGVRHLFEPIKLRR